MKICVYAICKNEAAFVEKFCNSAKDADLIVIADTGSTDNTVELAKQQPKTVVHEICVSPWRFDLARNVALCLVPNDVDVCISLDLDEVLEPGWRQEIERVWKPETTRLRYKYDWGSGIQFFYEKIHHRHGYIWRHPAHEYVYCDPRKTEVKACTDMLVVTHHPDPTKSRGQYLDILKLGALEDPHCHRNLFYYGRELYFYRHWAECIPVMLKFLANPKATWNSERSYAMRIIGKCFSGLNKPNDALTWYKKAANEEPTARESWYELAGAYYLRKDWEACLNACKSGIAITAPLLTHTANPIVWKEPLYDLASIAAWNLGRKDEALDYCKTAAKIAPADARIAANLAMMQQEIEKVE